MRRILYILGSLFLVFALFETGIRLLSPDSRYQNLGDITEVDTSLRDWANQEMYERTTDGLFYILKPNEEYNVNIDRYRGRKIDVEKNQNVYRILVLGDSTAFGVGVSYEETFCEKLCGLIENNHGKKAECINAGVPGYTSLQGLRLFKKRFKTYTPDIVFTYFGNNDGSSILPQSDKELKILPESMVKSYDVLSKSKLFNLLQYLYLKHFALKSYTPKQRVSEEDFRKNLLEIKDISESIGAKSYFITAVLLNDMPDRAQYLKRSLYIETEESIDPTQGLLESGYGFEELFMDDCHPSALGHSVIAGIIYKRLIEDSMI